MSSNKAWAIPFAEGYDEIIKAQWAAKCGMIYKAYQSGEGGHIKRVNRILKAFKDHSEICFSRQMVNQIVRYRQRGLEA